MLADCSTTEPASIPVRKEEPRHEWTLSCAGAFDHLAVLTAYGPILVQAKTCNAFVLPTSCSERKVSLLGPPGQIHSCPRSPVHRCFSELVAARAYDTCERPGRLRDEQMVIRCSI